MFNYSNIGDKIKNLAQVLFVLGAIVDISLGIILMGTDEDLIIFGLLLILLGPVVTWVSSWLLYGFGQLIENSDIIADTYNRKKEFQEIVVDASKERKQNVAK